MLVFDIDHFKAVKDQFGHPAGDRVLADLGRAIRALLRNGDFAVRLGGDEILVLLAQCTATDAVDLV